LVALAMSEHRDALVLGGAKPWVGQRSGRVRIVTHKFSVGQIVDLLPTKLRSAARGAYEIRHLLPASDSSPGNPCYRIKSIDESHERVVPESDLKLPTRSETVFS
jgi:hypothetical protein